MKYTICHKCDGCEGNKMTRSVSKLDPRNRDIVNFLCKKCDVSYETIPKILYNNRSKKMTTSPVPCCRCGMNFMRRDLNPEALRICNNCSLKERNPIKKENSMSEDVMSVKITLPRLALIQIEEICTNDGIDLSRYFLDLHESGAYSAVRIDNDKSENQKLFEESAENSLQPSIAHPVKKKKRK